MPITINFNMNEYIQKERKTYKKNLMQTGFIFLILITIASIWSYVLCGNVDYQDIDSVF